MQRDALAWVRDILVVLSCLVFLFAAYKVESAISSFQQGFGGTECYDPGGGTVCAPGGPAE